MKRLAAVVLATLSLVAGTARAQPPVIGFTMSSGFKASSTAARVALPSADTPNSPGGISIPVSFTTAPASPERLSVEQLRPIWQQAGAAYGVPWQVLGAINKIESNFGQNMGPSSAGAVGWMQFMPSTWLRWGTDADGNGLADPWTAADAIYSAARYLAAAGGGSDIRRAIFAYNHADWYVNEVLDLSKVYGQAGPAQTADLQNLQATLDAARHRVVAASRAAVAAELAVTRLTGESRTLHAQAERTELLSDRLDAEKQAVLFDGRVHAAALRAAAARAALGSARDGLQTARQKASAASFAPGVGTVMGAPAYSGGYVFPVGGGPQLVSVAHHHHDYPAADIAAPEGSPLYSLADGVVESAWSGVDPRCGIGFTMRAFDGQVWTYCHMAYREPAVQAGASLHGGQPVGLVGSTGDASGPHLHLQLQPPTSYPQSQPWFEGFAGIAFRWQDAPTPSPTRGLTAVSPAQRAVFAGDADSGPVIAFTR
jgi:murein DD-endopeptidase MepM/ murein hydrolase activator NlpD